MSTRIWYLLGRKLSGEAGIEELRELEALLLANPALASKIEIHEKYFNHKKQLSQNTLADDAWQKIQHQIAPQAEGDKKIYSPKNSLKFLRKPWWAAAALAIVSIGIFLITKSSIGLKGAADGHFGNAEIVKTSVDEKTKTILPDGSTVWLNKDSRITCSKDFGKSNREITLVGEAFFDVVHKAELPMVVHAGAVSIKVKGTAFNIKNYPSEHKVEAALIRGSIELEMNIGNRKQRVLMLPNEKITVLDNAVVKSVKQQPESIMVKEPLVVEQQSGLIPEVAWIQNQLVFNKESFVSLAEKMGKWYGVSIIINDSALREERFTGVFKNENLEEALNALQFTYGFRYKIDGDKVYITKNK